MRLLLLGLLVWTVVGCASPQTSNEMISVRVAVLNHEAHYDYGLFI